MDYYFPFEELRTFQKEFMDGVYDTLLDKKNLLVHAPTGVGKTVSVLAPVLKFAVEQKKVVFFLTSRNSQHMIAVETLRAVKDKFGLHLGREIDSEIIIPEFESVHEL